MGLRCTTSQSTQASSTSPQLGWNPLLSGQQSSTITSVPPPQTKSVSPLDWCQHASCALSIMSRTRTGDSIKTRDACSIRTSSRFVPCVLDFFDLWARGTTWPAYYCTVQEATKGAIYTNLQRYTAVTMATHQNSTQVSRHSQTDRSIRLSLLQKMVNKLSAIIC